MSRAWPALALGLILVMQASAAEALDTHRRDVREFVAHMVKTHGFKRRQLNKWLRAASSQSSIIDAMDRPAEKAKLWYEYRQIFITEKRIRDGTEFWNAHRGELEKASAATGVAPEFIVAILGVETQYGRQTGRYRVLDSLSTLAFDYPSRSQFFLSELEQFLLLTREAKISPLTATGSYAGAMGAPQFMPSSYRRFGVDGDGDGRIDLWSDWPDVFTSVGNYFKEHGWQTGEPTMTEASIEPLQTEGLDGRHFELSESVGSLQAQGVRFESPLSAAAPAFVIAVDRPDGLNWCVGFKNFYVITRYNRSALYAMAASELADALKFNANQEQPAVLSGISGAWVIDALPRELLQAAAAP
jgi:membrane-bound lytic murein transglycosylase B